ncbi:MAG: (2Fe-2S)-binding protein [Lachnospiraceae bacterium]|nr:(2Fe-2S)-binding protein [Lachnospiraceae bacterium]
MDLDKIVCNCMGVTAARIKEAVDAGASTLAEVQEATGAGTVCGACLEEVESLISHFTAQRDA